MLIKDEAIILKEIDYKDFHKIIHAFSKNSGKISFIARNAKRPKNKNISPLKIFSHVDLVLYRGKDLDILNNSSIINSFYKLNDNYNKYIYASYIAEVLNSIIIEEANEKVFDMSLKFFKIIESEKDISNLVTAYELKLVSLLGFRPQLYFCTSCHKKDYKYFSINQGGLICSECIDGNDYIENISRQDIETLREIINLKFEEIKEISISYHVKHIVRDYLMYHLDKYNFKSLKFLEDI